MENNVHGSFLSILMVGTSHRSFCCCYWLWNWHREPRSLCLLSFHPFYWLRHKWASISGYLLCARWTKQRANKKIALLFSTTVCSSNLALKASFTSSQLCVCLWCVQWLTLISPPPISYSPFHLNNTFSLYD